jgi:hypothetical protein
MGHAPVVLSVWAISILLFIAIKLYASRMARDEESQLFLGESFENEKSAQSAIVAKVHKIEPIQRGAMVLVALTTLAVVAYYVLDIVHQF